MHSTDKSEVGTLPQRDSGLWGWLNRRTGLDDLLRSALDEPIPGGARFAYIFGSGLLFIFISQVITGIFLALYYVPSADHAHTTVAYITKAVTDGSFLRSLHAYFATHVGANAGIAVPLIGESLKRMMRGGTEMGTLTISRFFVAHVFFIPACVFALVASHIFLFRKAGAAGPVDENPYEPKQKTELFYPRQVLMDLSLRALLIIGLGALSFFAPM